MNWRQIKGVDLPAVYRLADEVYPPHLFETDAAILARVNLGAGFSHVLMDGRDLRGYVIAHPWDLTVPKLGLGVGYPVGGFRTIYLHDLALLPAARGRGLGAEVVDQIKESAARAFGSIRLVSVNGSLSYWSRRGFRAIEDDRGGIGTYGADAVLMEWRPLCGSMTHTR